MESRNCRFFPLLFPWEIGVVKHRREVPSRWTEAAFPDDPPWENLWEVLNLQMFKVNWHRSMHKLMPSPWGPSLVSFRITSCRRFRSFKRSEDWWNIYDELAVRAQAPFSSRQIGRKIACGDVLNIRRTIIQLHYSNMQGFPLGMMSFCHIICFFLGVCEYARESLCFVLLVSWIWNWIPCWRANWTGNLNITSWETHEFRPWKCHQAPSGGVVNSSDLQEAEGLAAWLEAMKFGPKLAGPWGGWGMVLSLACWQGRCWLKDQKRWGTDQPKMFASDVAMIVAGVPEKSFKRAGFAHFFPNSQGIVWLQYSWITIKTP